VQRTGNIYRKESYSLIAIILIKENQ